MSSGDGLFDDLEESVITPPKSYDEDNIPGGDFEYDDDIEALTKMEEEFFLRLQRHKLQEDRVLQRLFKTIKEERERLQLEPFDASKKAVQERPSIILKKETEEKVEEKVEEEIEEEEIEEEVVEEKVEEEIEEEVVEEKVEEEIEEEVNIVGSSKNTVELLLRKAGKDLRGPINNNTKFEENAEKSLDEYQIRIMEEVELKDVKHISEMHQLGLLNNRVKELEERIKNGVIYLNRDDLTDEQEKKGELYLSNYTSELEKEFLKISKISPSYICMSELCKKMTLKIGRSWLSGDVGEKLICPVCGEKVEIFSE